MEIKKNSIIAVVDVGWIGHHPTYFKIVVRALLKRGLNVWAFCPKPDEVRCWVYENCNESECKRFLAFLFSSVSTSGSAFPSNAPSATLLTAYLWIHTAIHLEQAARQERKMIDFVFFPTLDSWMGGAMYGYIVDKIFPYQWSGVYFNPKGIRTPDKKYLNRLLKSPHAVLMSRRLASVATLDENSMKGLMKALKKQVIHFPDITDEAEVNLELPLVRNVLEKAKKRKIIALLGNLSLRKGASLFMRAAKKLKEESFFFLMAGELGDIPSSDIQELDGLENTFIHCKRLQDGVEFNSLVKICDIIHAAYINFPFSSNTLTKAAMLHKPVIVSSGGLMEERILKFKTGTVIRENNEDDYLNALRAPFLKDANYEAYFADHSIRRAEEVIGMLIRC